MLSCCFASQQVDSVSWHQLIAKGYGLVNNIEEIQSSQFQLNHWAKYNATRKSVNRAERLLNLLQKN